MENLIVKFKVINEIQGKARVRANFHTHTLYTPNSNREYEKIIAEAFKQAKENDFMLNTNAIKININAYMKKPKKLRSIFPTKKPDCDNIAKIVLDALNKIAYEDDKQVIELKVKKEWLEGSEKEYLLISIYEILN